MASHRRDYDAIAARILPAGSREQRMQHIADTLWDALSDRGVSWVGFYLDQPGEPDDRRLVLGPHRDKPACSPLAMHGVCGQTVRFRTTRIVEDVSQVKSEYIACDPRDRSEIAIPLVDAEGTCWGCLDLDSWDISAFDERDEQGLIGVLQAAGLLPT